MSSVLKIAIGDRLAGVEAMTGAGLAAQQALASLLGVDPDTTEPAVHNGNKSKVVIYPAITFRESAGSSDGRFGLHGVGVDNPVYDFEFWSNTESATIISDIDKQVDILLDRRFQLDSTGSEIIPGIAVDNTHGRIFHATTFVPLYEGYDHEMRASYGLKRYRFVEARF